CRAERIGLADDARGQALHARLLAELQQGGAARWVAPSTGAVATTGGEWNGEQRLSFSPLRVGGELAFVVELVHQPDLSPAAQQGCERLVDAFCELAVEWQRCRQLIDSRERDQFWTLWEQFTRRIHSSLSLEATASELANEGRRVLEVDRVAVVLGEGGRVRTLAISGVDVVERRSGVVRALEAMVTAVLRVSEPLWFSGSTSQLAPQLQDPVDAYLDAAHPRALAVLPLHLVRDGEEPWTTEAGGRGAGRYSGPAFAALVCERYTGAWRDDIGWRAALLADQAQLALGNAWEYSSLPAAGWLRWLRGTDGPARPWRRRRRFVAAILAAAVLAALVFVEIDFKLAVSGALQPREIRDVFAIADGEVRDVLVRHSQRVRAGEPLLRMRSPTLELEYLRVTGERDATRERLAAAESARLTDGERRRGSSRDDAALSGSTEELRQLLASQERQVALLARQRAELEVKAPSDGAVLTWNVDELLESRPVKRGQVLLSIGDTTGDWELTLDLPDHQAGHFLAAQASLGDALSVSFTPAGRPGVVRSGKVREVARVTEADRDGTAKVRIRVELSRDEQARLDDDLLRPGATVHAKIHCGRKPAGFVWLHGLWEF
ncbi:MAG TPA: HlyD family efflux transporter periplasmic adaptor subunit, partial [Pirellulaceae bacterium]|nr:HlyD family efflux transporter periplasmic adaptor subunit [Pirellulaceae bacterium]